MASSLKCTWPGQPTKQTTNTSVRPHTRQKTITTTNIKQIITHPTLEKKIYTQTKKITTHPTKQEQTQKQNRSLPAPPPPPPGAPLRTPSYHPRCPRRCHPRSLPPLKLGVPGSRSAIVVRHHHLRGMFFMCVVVTLKSDPWPHPPCLG